MKVTGRRFRGLGAVLLVALIFLISAGCGGSSSSTPAPPAGVTITGAVTFPGTTAAKMLVGVTTPPATMQIVDLNGTVVATPVLTVDAADTTGKTFRYSATVPATQDYILKAAWATQSMRALADKSVMSQTNPVANVNVTSTAAVIVAEKKLNIEAGTLGSSSNNVTATDIAALDPALLLQTVGSDEALVAAVTSAVSAGQDPATVTAVDTAANAVATAYTPPPPTAPTGVTATAASGQVTLTWTAVNGAASYNVYYRTSTGVTTTNGTAVPADSTTTTIASLINETTYYFVVTAVNTYGESGVSSEVYATPAASRVGKYALIVDEDTLFTLDVAANGTVSGSAGNIWHEAYNFSGAINSSGVITGTLSEGLDLVPITINPSFDASGNVSGTLVAPDGTFPFTGFKVQGLDSSLTGSYDWVQTGTDDTGGRMVVAADGSMSGRVINKYGETYSVSGYMNSASQVAFQVALLESGAVEAVCFGQATGFAISDGAEGVAIVSPANNRIVKSLSSSFAGLYTGTSPQSAYFDAETFEVVVDPYGYLVGFAKQTSNGAITPLRGTVNMTTGAFSVTSQELNPNDTFTDSTDPPDTGTITGSSLTGTFDDGLGHTVTYTGTKQL